MKIQGLYPSGEGGNNYFVLTDEDDEKEVIFPIKGGGINWISGSILNLDTVDPIEVNFYNSNKELKLVSLGPKKKLVFQNMPSDRLQFKRILNAQDVTNPFEYRFVVVQSESKDDVEKIAPYMSVQIQNTY